MGFRVSREMDSTISQHLTPSTMHRWQCLMVYTVSRLSYPFLIRIGLSKLSIYDGYIVSQRMIKFIWSFYWITFDAFVLKHYLMFCILKERSKSFATRLSMYMETLICWSIYLFIFEGALNYVVYHHIIMLKRIMFCH